MSSREIAKVCEKRHDHVMRDIRVMLEQIDDDAAKFGGSYAGGNGEARPCFYLLKDRCLLLVTGYDVILRWRVIERWKELESERSQPALPNLADCSSPN